ncbi:arginase family protein [Candidatus Daviesbacteria bacterium]|nr:arginase family protein [Candidatus Daviesbacteria bacterium]
MKTPHFFKAISRIGLINPPIRQKEFNIGVEEAPDFILDGIFLSNFTKEKELEFVPHTKLVEISEYVFSKPEEIGLDKYYQILAKELTEFKQFINANLKKDQIQVVIGGDNSVTLASLLAVFERVDSKSVGYIQFDSHGEMNSYKNSPSKNFHGMYMRALLEKFDIPEVESIAQPKIGFEQVLTIGDQVLDGDEPAFYKKNNIRNIKREEFLNKREQIREELIGFLKKYQHIHINFDVDIFHRSVAPATGIAEDGKWMWEDVVFLINIIRENNQNLSVDSCEINPMRKGSKKTIKVAQEVLLKLLKD